MGRYAIDGVPALFEISLNKKKQVLQSRASLALKKIGPAAIPAYTGIIKDKKISTPVQHAALDILGEMGPAAGEAVPVLIDSLKDQKIVVRSKAAIALGKIGPEAKDAIPALKETLKDDNILVRKNAKWALSEIEE